jgi:hypothetical protein
MTNQNCSWHVCDDCLEPLAKRIASQAGGYSSFVPGRIVVSDLLNEFKFDLAIEVLAANLTVEYANRVEARVSALRRSVRQVNDMAFKYYLEEHGPLPHDYPEHLKDEIWASAAWKYSEKSWSYLTDDNFSSNQEIEAIATCYQKLHTQTIKLAKYLITVSTSVRAKLDGVYRLTPATSLQTCLHRLQHLPTWFQKVENAQQLLDAMQEGGHILAVIVRDQHLPEDELLPGGGNILAEYISQSLEDKRKANPMETKGMARSIQIALWELVALMGTDRQKQLIHSPNTLKTGILPKSTDYENNYASQGRVFSKVARWVLEKLEARQRSVPKDGKADEEASAARPRKGDSRVGAPRAKDTRKERRIREAWQTGNYREYKDCDDSLGIEPGTTKKTVDKLRQRDRRRRQ